MIVTHSRTFSAHTKRIPGTCARYQAPRSILVTSASGRSYNVVHVTSMWLFARSCPQMTRFGHSGTSSLLPSIAALSNKRSRNVCCVKSSSDSNSNQSSMIRDAVVEDRHALIALAGDTGLFPTPEELAEFTEGLDRFYEGSYNVEHAWLVCEVDGSVAGAAYYAPDGTHYPSPLQGDGVWNMYFIGVQPSRQRHGVGSRLLEEVETQLRSREGKRLVIETSGKGSFEHIRAFYAKHGYDAGDVTADFYGPGDDKVMFNKFL